ncbi:hypothetical protein MM236_03535 [Belliella sp. DSM 107340]|uniref:TolB-like 6-blade propeller-like n=1 Tax=Belliella calami TaxID=2923436 RepID=A0ABS9UK96_9BACT|nr:hypothetical protein [Belliella calami]MCH7397041.1 hypothetical protein [Belliella calami]
MKNYYCLIIIFAFFSCRKNEESNKSTDVHAYQLVKVDSFAVDNFTNVQITDYCDSENIFLGFSEVQNDILEISPTGEIQKRINLSGDGPGKLGRWNPLGLSFGPDGKRVFQLPFQLLTYDKDYNQIENIRFLSPLPVRTNLPLGKTAYTIKNGEPQYLVGPTTFLSAHLLIYNEEGRDTLQNFMLLSSGSGSIKSIVPYEPNSYYKKTENIYMDLMGKSFFVEDNELIVLQNLAENIQVYDINDYTLKKEIPIEHSEFITYDPLPIGTAMDDPRTKELSAMAGRNQSIYKMSEDIWLVKYYQGVTRTEYESRNTEEKQFSINGSASDKIKMLVIKNGVLLSGEISPPEGKLLFSFEKNRLLVKDNPNEEVEEEFTSYSIYELKESNK